MSEWFQVYDMLPTTKQEPKIKVLAVINEYKNIIVECNFRMIATKLSRGELIPHWFSDRNEEGYSTFYYTVSKWKYKDSNKS